MKTSQAGIDLIKRFEGFESRAYKCPAGVWTIGYGHTETAVDGDTITEEDAEALLRNDVQDAEMAVSSLVTRNLTQNQFDALVSFVFNVGRGAFRKSTLRKRVNAMRDADAAVEFGKWNKAGGKVLEGLKLRRAAEANMYMELPWL